MRKKWLSLATLLVGGGAAEAQQFPQMPPAGYAAGHAAMPPASPYGYPGGMPGAAPAFGYGPQAPPFVPTSGLPAQPFAPASVARPPMSPIQPPMIAPMPPFPTVPITEVDPSSLPGEPFA